MKIFSLLVALVASQQQNLGWIFVTDDGGPDDEVAQADVNYMGFNKDNQLYAEVSWSWDDTVYPGSNSGDGCSLWDLNGNGNADFALCVRVNTVGSAVNLALTQLFDCKDAKPATCSIAGQPGYSNPANNSEMISAPGGGTKLKSSCRIDFMTDAFLGQHLPGETNPFNDTRAICRLYYDELTENGIVQPGNPQLINVCSYPSSQPTSDFKDCVVLVGSGFLVINKWTNQAQGCQTVKAYGLDCGGANLEASCDIYKCDEVPRQSWNFTYSQSGTVKKRASVYGWGWSPLVTLPSGSYQVSEGNLPAGWIQVGFRCADNQTNPEAVQITSGQTLICYFVNYFGTIENFTNTYGNFSAGTANITLDVYEPPRSFAPTPSTQVNVTCPQSLGSFFSSCNDNDFGNASCSAGCLAAATSLGTDFTGFSAGDQNACISNYNMKFDPQVLSFTSVSTISTRVSASQPICAAAATAVPTAAPASNSSDASSLGVSASLMFLCLFY